MKISVYITSYNQKYFLKEAIESVLNQTLKAFEIIIVDDCSTDGSQDLIVDYANKYNEIKFVFHEINKGVSHVRVSALKMVKGDYVTYLDGDDLYLPNKLQVEANVILKENCELAFSNNMYVKEGNTNKVMWIWATNPIIINGDTNLFVKTISRDFPRGNLFRMELINYNLLKQVGFHDTNLKIYEDYDLRIRLSKSLKFGYSLEPTTKIRISKDGLSKSSFHEHKLAFEYILKKYLAEIDELDQQTSIRIRTILNKHIDKFSVNSKRASKTLSFKNKVKNKLIRIIKSI